MAGAAVKLTRIALASLCLAAVTLGALLRFTSADAGLINITGSRHILEAGGDSGSWAERSTAEGVIWATDFPDDASVSNWRWNNDGCGPSCGDWDPDSSAADSELITYQASGSFRAGSGVMRLEDVPAGVGLNQALWGRTLDNTATSGNNDNDFVVPPGTPLYLQFAFKTNAARLDEAGNDGLKIASLTCCANNSNTNQEMFFGRQFSREFPMIQGATTTQSDPWESIDLGGGNFDLQPGSTFGSCLYPGPSGCWLLHADEWVTVYIRLVGGTEGGQNTQVRVQVAREGETVWTKWYDRADNFISAASGGYQGVDGYAAAIFWNRAQDTSDNTAGMYHFIDDVIVSLDEIAIPSP